MSKSIRRDPDDIEDFYEEDITAFKKSVTRVRDERQRKIENKHSFIEDKGGIE